MKKSEPYYVIFEVTKITKKLNIGSSIKINDRFVGMFDPLENTVSFSDINEDDWVFKVGETCNIIDSI